MNEVSISSGQDRRDISRSFILRTVSQRWMERLLLFAIGFLPFDVKRWIARLLLFATGFLPFDDNIALVYLLV